MIDCECSAHQPLRIVLTGGPGAGKTAVLEVLRAAMCRHVRVLPEAAGIVFGGGFPRGTELELRRAAQRAIVHVQHELEATLVGADAALVMCDRGTIDSAAYWPGPDDLWMAVNSSHDAELARYHAVIHLRTPSASHGYDHSNPIRIETAEEAAAIDDRIAIAWRHHPRRFEVPATQDFFAKVTQAIALVARHLPPCCRRPEIDRATRLVAS